MKQTVTSKNNIPQIRFSEFNTEWKIKKLGDIADVRDGTHESPQYIDQGYPLVTSKNLLKNGLLDLHNVSYISQKDYESINKRSGVNEGDILFGMIGTIGNPVQICTTGFAIKNVALIKNLGNLRNNYLINYLNTSSIARQFYTDNSGGTQKFIALGVIRNLRIAIPQDSEQERIADFLTVVDSKITSLDKKVELMKKYKKGVMQKIFAQEIRFIDEQGNEYPDWEEKRFGDSYEFLKTNSLSRALLQTTGDVKNIHYGDIHTKLSANFDSAKEVLSYLTSQNNSDYCQPGDLIVADASEDRKDAGRSVEVIKTHGEKIVAGLHTFLARPKIGIALGFSSYLMFSSQMRRQLWRIATGASVLGISKTELGKLIINLPSKEEQQKIADFLTAIDDIIQLEERKLAEAKKFKKALLHQMFV